MKFNANVGCECCLATANLHGVSFFYPPTCYQPSSTTTKIVLLGHWNADEDMQQAR